jgi:hypothetical protein
MLRPALAAISPPAGDVAGGVVAAADAGDRARRPRRKELPQLSAPSL